MRALYTILCLMSWSLCLAQWNNIFVDLGAKPSIAVTDSGIPHLGYMVEKVGGYAKHAEYSKISQDFDTATFKFGYFYGPLDITLDTNDDPSMVFHDHNLNGGDLAFSYFNSVWVNDAVSHTGHDGWDGEIRYDDSNHIHVISIDPVGFGGMGIEYGYNSGSGWQFDIVGTSPLMYANALGLDIDSVNDPHLTYYDDTDQSLGYAYKKGTWNIIKVDSINDPGRFSSLELDAGSLPHISYVSWIGGDTAVIKYTFFNGSMWTYETVDTLFNLGLGSAEARKSTALQFDNGSVIICYGDRDYVKVATRTGPDTWSIETLVDESLSPVVLGQQIDMAIDANLNYHICYYEVTSTSPLDGNIRYITNDLTITSTEENESELLIAPNPFHSFFSILTNDLKSYRLFDLSGRIVKTGNKSSVSTSGLGRGTYLLEIIRNSGKISRTRVISY